MQIRNIIILLSMMLFACKPTERIAKAPLKKTNTDWLTERTLLENNLTNSNFIIQRAEIEITDESGKENFIASLKFQKPDKYLVSIRSKSGIEVSRILVTSDTIMINDRLNRKFYYGSTSFIVKKYGIKLSGLPLIFGDYLGKEVPDNEKIECKNGIIDLESTIEGNSILYKINCGLQRSEQTVYKRRNGSDVVIFSYKNYNVKEEFKYPGTVSIADPSGKTKIIMEIKKIEPQATDSIRFIPGSNYEKIRIQ